MTYRTDSRARSAVNRIAHEYSDVRDSPAFRAALQAAYSAGWSDRDQDCSEMLDDIFFPKEDE
jgi:hypothetical protein